MRAREHQQLNEQQKAVRLRYLGKVRRSYSREALAAQVGWVGSHELHRIDCPEFATGARERRAVASGEFKDVFVALADDYVEGTVAFPALHDCLRGKPRRPSI